MKHFYDAIRLLFRGSFTKPQVEGIDAIVEYGVLHAFKLSHIAAALGTAYHETGGRMQPVREGFAKTDAGARGAVSRLFKAGRIRWNYAIPNSAGQSFYGRGLVQLTHEENYEKMEDVTGLPLVDDPDLVLDMNISVSILYTGMALGMFRHGRSLDMLPDNPTAEQWTASRGIINGDVKRNGARVAEYCKTFHKALDTLSATTPDLFPVDTFVPATPVPETIEDPYAAFPKETSVWKSLWKLLKWVLAKFGA